jgi:hypothetical protein
MEDRSVLWQSTHGLHACAVDRTRSQCRSLQESANVLFRDPGVACFALVDAVRSTLVFHNRTGMYIYCAVNRPQAIPNVGESSSSACAAIRCLVSHTRSTIAIFPIDFTFLRSNITGDTLITGDIAFPSKRLRLYRPSLIPA